jgi:hypothetical protein
MNLKILFVLLMLAGLQFALIMSGDAGEEWSKEKAQELCKEEGVGGVYICLGNVVDVVWEDESKGSTFYKPEGTVINCPPKAPTEMGAECMQLMMPNYCTLDDNVCGTETPEVFPGGETEGEIIYNGTPEQPEETPEEPTEPEETTPEEKKKTVIVGESSGTTQTIVPMMDDTLNNLIIIVFVLAVIAIIILFFIFKRTTGR